MKFWATTTIRGMNMVDFDGSTFLPIADSAVDADSPADTVFSHYLLNNIRYIERGYGRSSCAPLMPIADPEAAGAWGGKVYCGLREMAVKVIPIEFGAVHGVKKVTVDVYCHSITEGSLTGDGWVEVSARLQCNDFSVRGKALTSDRHMVRLELDIPVQNRPESGVLYLSVQGKDVVVESTIGSTTPISKTILFSNDGYSDDGPSSTNWVGAQMTALATATSGPEHVIAFNMDAGGDDFVATTGVTATIITPGIDAIKYNLPRVEIASYSVNIDYYSDEYFEPESLRSNIPEFADINRRFAAAQSTQFERPRLLSIGGQGDYRNDTGAWPDEFRSDWSYVDGDATETELMRVSVDSVAQLGLLTIYPVIAAVHLTSPSFDEVANVVTSGTVRNNRTQAAWDLTLKVEQYADGLSAPTEIASSTGRFRIDHYPAAKMLETPLLQQAYYQWSESATDDYELTYKEGVLVGEDEGWFDFLQHTIQSGLGDLVDGVPFDIVLTAVRNEDVTVDYGYTPILGFGSGPRASITEFNDPQYLRLFLLNHSIYFQRVEE